MAQIPPGPHDCYCPLWRKRMSQVCHTCPLWVHVEGKNPQGENTFDEWRCSWAWLPLLIVEAAQRMNQAGASADKVATEVKRFHEGMAKQNAQMTKLLAGPGGSGG